MRPLRIGLVIDRLDPARGGAEAYLVALARFLAGNGHRVGSVANGQHPLRKPPVFAIQSLYELAFPGLPNHDGRSAELRQVESVEGLTQLQEHVVGGVHHIVDGPGACSPDPCCQPRGRRSHFHPPDHTPQIARAEIRVVDSD